jgi:5-methylcytosine-specific restriction protein B
VQFHPSYAYEDFVEGLRPRTVAGALSYPVMRGTFLRLCDAARAQPARRYALVLDELNRGELPRIFGELLYLLEYRDEAVILPYSGEAFSVPPNVYLIGTMNTADRSIALVDHALRRRFHFVALRPSAAVLRAYLAATGRPDLAWTADVLERANELLAQDGVEWHLHVGHSHFMRPDLDAARARLIWEHSVLPMLEEIFYRRPERLADYQFDALREADA